MDKYGNRQRLVKDRRARVARAGTVFIDMQDGVYKVWFSGPGGQSGGAIALRGGDILGSDGGYALVGRYSLALGRLSGRVTCTRLDDSKPNPAFPDGDTFHLLLEGKPGDSFASLRASVEDDPSYSILFELTRVCEA